MAKPTHQDASLIIQMAQVAALRGVPGLNWLSSSEFDPDYAAFIKKNPRGSEGYGKALLIAQHYEGIGTLWKHGLINEDLLFDWLWIAGMWERLKGFVLGGREEYGEPRLGENFEAMANASIEWGAQRKGR
jgi:hypothetical protein